MRFRGGWTTCLLLALMVNACGTDGEADHNPGALYPDRANQYREDQERHIGEPVEIGGYTATVTDARLDEASGSIRVDIEITNRDEQSQRVDGTHWTLVNPRVQTIEATTAAFPVNELTGGSTVSASVSYEVDADEAGDYYIQYKPEALDAARGIWQLTVSEE